MWPQGLTRRQAHGGARGYAEGHTHAYGCAHGGARMWTRSRGLLAQAHTRVSTHTCTQAHSPGASGRQGVRPPRGRVPFAHLIQKLSARKPGGEQNVKCVLRGAACPLSWRAMIWSVSEHDELRIICAFRAGFGGGAWGKGGCLCFVFNFLSCPGASSWGPLSAPGRGGLGTSAVVLGVRELLISRCCLPCEVPAPHVCWESLGCTTTPVTSLFLGSWGA